MMNWEPREAASSSFCSKGVQVVGVGAGHDVGDGEVVPFQAVGKGVAGAEIGDEALEGVVGRGRGVFEGARKVAE